MQSENEIIIKNWLFKADEALKDAQKALDSDSLTNAQNRIYYGIFYSVMALGYFEGFITSKHAQLLGWFNKTFIKEKIFDKRLGEIYRKAYDNRMKSDYTITFTPDSEVVLKMLGDARLFVEQIKKYIYQDKQ